MYERRGQWPFESGTPWRKSSWRWRLFIAYKIFRFTKSCAYLWNSMSMFSHGDSAIYIFQCSDSFFRDVFVRSGICEPAEDTVKLAWPASHMGIHPKWTKRPTGNHYFKQGLLAPTSFFCSYFVNMRAFPHSPSIFVIFSSLEMRSWIISFTKKYSRFWWASFRTGSLWENWEAT